MTQVRMKPEERKAQLTAAAYGVAKKHGVKAVTRLAVAEVAGCTDGLMNRYFKGRAGLREAAIAEAVKVKDVPTLAYAKGQEGFALPKDMPRQLMRDVNAHAYVANA